MSEDLGGFVKSVIDSGNLAAVIQCGGRGRRAGVVQPKPLAILSDSDRPITDVIRDLPISVQVFLHLLREHRDIYIEYLNPNGNFGHNISYLIQQEDRLFDKHGTPLQNRDGTQITASNGSATFIRHFVNPPEYFAIIDGAKTGVYFPDIEEALKILIEDSSLGAIVFARELTDAQIESEKANYKKSHTRYARLNSDAQAIYEHPDMREWVIGKKEWLALAGTYVVRSSDFMKRTKRMKGSLTESESINSLFEGFAHHLKLSMTLYGYNGRHSGLNFKTFIPTHYIPGIKTKEDIQAYPEWKRQGVFDYRERKDGK